MGSTAVSCPSPLHWFPEEVHGSFFTTLDALGILWVHVKASLLLFLFPKLYNRGLYILTSFVVESFFDRPTTALE